MIKNTGWKKTICIFGILAVGCGCIVILVRNVIGKISEAEDVVYNDILSEPIDYVVLKREHAILENNICTNPKSVYDNPILREYLEDDLEFEAEFSEEFDSAPVVILDETTNGYYDFVLPWTQNRIWKYSIEEEMYKDTATSLPADSPVTAPTVTAEVDTVPVPSASEPLDPDQAESEYPAQPPVSYAEQCALDYVEPPVKRTRGEAIERLKELSVQFPQLTEVVEKETEYPDGILTSVANNPEMTDFAYGYLDSDGSVTGGFTEAELEQDYPLFLQFDIRWGYYPYGMTVMGDSGCGPTCLSMAIFYLTRNAEITPDVIGKYSMENGYYVTDVGTAWSLLDDYPALHGLKTSNIAITEGNMKAELDAGNILICSMRPGNFTAGGHFIIVYGYDENGFKVNDPKCVYRSTLEWTYEQLGAEIKRIWSVGK